MKKKWIGIKTAIRPLKICGKCEIPKLYSEFYSDPHTQDKHKATCKACSIKYQIKRYRESKEVREKQSHYYKTKRKNNPEYRAKQNISNKLHNSKNRNKLLIYWKEYFQRNKAKKNMYCLLYTSPSPRD